MAQQQQHQQTSQQQQDDEEVADVQPAKRDTELVEHADELLDEIDDVLEANAEQFVQAFQQKGGQ